MREKNRQTLFSALRQMPSHEPKSSVWDKIACKLEEEKEKKQVDALGLALQNLPQHEPPERIWQAIEKDLNEAPQRKKMFFMRAAAATLLALTASLWLLYPNSKNPANESKFTYRHSTEEVSTSLLQMSWNEDEEAFAEIEKLLENLKPENSSEEITQLQQELRELNLAKAELQQIAGNYNSNPNFATQLKEIELERTQIAKQLLRKII